MGATQEGPYMICAKRAANNKTLLVAINTKSSAGVFAIATDFLIIFVILYSPPRHYESITIRIIPRIFESNGPQLLKVNLKFGSV